LLEQATGSPLSLAEYVADLKRKVVDLAD
jgi:hypothetical protein